MRIAGYGKSFSLFIFLLAFSSLFQLRAEPAQASLYNPNAAIFVSTDETLSKTLSRKGDKFEVFDASCVDLSAGMADCGFSYKRTNALGTQICINVPAAFYKVYEEKYKPLGEYLLSKRGFDAEGQCGEYEKVVVKPIIEEPRTSNQPEPRTSNQPEPRTSNQPEPRTSNQPEPRTSNQSHFYISLLVNFVLTGFILYLLATRDKE